MVGHVFDDVGVYNHASRRAVDDDVVVFGTQGGYALVEAGIAEQFGRIWRDGAGEERINTRCHDIVLDERRDVVDFAGKVVD